MSHLLEETILANLWHLLIPVVAPGKGGASVSEITFGASTAAFKNVRLVISGFAIFQF